MSRLVAAALVVVTWLLVIGPACAVVPEIKDDGKFFSPDALKKANEMIREIYRKTGKDLLIESFATIPADELAKVKDLTNDEKKEFFSKFFSKWVKERSEKALVNGVYILVCKDPTRVEVRISEKARSAISPKQVFEPLLTEFRKKRFDEGLLAVVKAVQERLDKPKAE